MERDGKDGNSEGEKDGETPEHNGDAEMKDAEGKKKEDEDDIIDSDILRSTTRDIQMRRRLLENDMRINRSEYNRLDHEQAAMKEKIKDNLDKIENNRYVPELLTFDAI